MARESGLDAGKVDAEQRQVCRMISCKGESMITCMGVYGKGIWAGCG